MYGRNARNAKINIDFAREQTGQPHTGGPQIIRGSHEWEWTRTNLFLPRSRNSAIIDFNLILLFHPFLNSSSHFTCLPAPTISSAPERDRVASGDASRMTGKQLLVVLFCTSCADICFATANCSTAFDG